MCRLVGIVASELTEFGLALREAPRCLATLSHEHPDGWGIAIHEKEWMVERGIERAASDGRFHQIATSSRGHVLLAHIRQKTVGPTRLENTHPFTQDGWVFAHNGTVTDVPTLRAGASSARLARIEGDTDSEVLFAYLLTKLEGARDADTQMAVLDVAVRELRAKAVGAFNFLLSNGDTTFVHRFGRSLYVLERGPKDPVRTERDLDSNADLTTSWTPRRRAVFVASERLTDEPWVEVPDATLFRIDRLPFPMIVGAEEQRRAS